MGIEPQGPDDPTRPGERGIGTHLLLDFYEVSSEHLMDASLLSQALCAAARAAGMTPLLPKPVLHRFPGGGLTGFMPLAESHIAFHGYPEFGYLAADVFTCGDDPGAPDRAVAVLTEALAPGRVCVRRVRRGEGIGP